MGADCNDNGMAPVGVDGVVVGLSGAVVSGSSSGVVTGSSSGVVAGSSSGVVAGSSGGVVSGSSSGVVAGSSGGAALRAVREAAARAAAINEEPTTEAINLIDDHRSRYVQSSGMVQTITISRADLVADCIALTMSNSFIAAIRRPLRVNFPNEEGVDGGALKNDVLGLISKHFEPFLEVDYVPDEADDPIRFAAGIWNSNFVSSFSKFNCIFLLSVFHIFLYYCLFLNY